MNTDGCGNDQAIDSPQDTGFMGPGLRRDDSEYVPYVVGTAAAVRPGPIIVSCGAGGAWR